MKGSFRTLSIIVVASVILFGCSSAPTQTAKQPPTVDVTGTWNGTYVGTNGSFPVQMTLRQIDADVTGDAVITGDGWTILSYSGAVSGTVSGKNFSYTYQGGGADVIVDTTEMRGQTSRGNRLLMRRQ